jgi:serine/threonine protein kinase
MRPFQRCAAYLHPPEARFRAVVAEQAAPLAWLASCLVWKRGRPMKNTHLTALDSNSHWTSGPPSSEDRPSSAGRKSNPGHAPGDILAGKYEIVSLLGEGGMGTVWRARSLALDVDIALKVLHCDRADSHAAQRLLREARATASIGHPAIVRAFDFGETEQGEPFLVMELLEGISLADWLERQGRMSATQAVQMLLPIVAGLVAAHARGIIHRDIKPENIIIVPDGASTFLPKIVDFGIAKMSRRSNQVITQAGMVLGSLEYMSPEQAEGKQEVGEPTDVWALCVVLYELITGRRPFEGDSITQMIYALYTLDPVPVTRFAAGDDELWEILAHGLQKAPEDRLPTMLELGRSLAAWATHRGITVDASGRSLALQWLDTAPEEMEESPISWSGPAVAPYWPRVSLPSIDPVAKTQARPAPVDAPSAPRLGTIELPCAATDWRIAAPPAPRRARPPLFGALIALIAAPLLVAATIYASTGTAGSGETTFVAAAATEIPTGIAWTTTPDYADSTTRPAVAPIAVAAPQAIVTATPTSKARDQRPASSARPSRASKSMPLPAAPDF